jgi:ribonuclease T2
MKHTTNTHHVQLDTSTNYTVLKSHKGQFLVKIPGESPATRWVDNSCFSDKKNQKIKKVIKKHYSIKKKKHSAVKPSANRQDLLILSWQNTFCETHRNTRECKILTRQNKSLLGLHGLWPQPRSKSYCNVPRKQVAKDKHHQWRALPKPKLSSQTATKLMEIMPGYSSALHHHEWIKHGTCYGTDADQYYSDAARWTAKISDGSIGKILQSNIGKRITLKQLRISLDKDFGKGAGDRLDLRCDHGKISELWIHLGGDAPDLETRIKASSRTRSRCQGGIVDAPGY